MQSTNAQAGASAGATLTATAPQLLAAQAYYAAAASSTPPATEIYPYTRLSVTGFSYIFVKLTNPNGVPLTNVAFTSNFPSDVFYDPSNGDSGIKGISGSVCTGTFVPSANGFAVSAATIPANSSCGYVIQIKSAVAGTKIVSTSTVTATNASTGPGTSMSIYVFTPMVVSFDFDRSSALANGWAKMTYTFSNPVANPEALTGIAQTVALGVAIPQVRVARTVYESQPSGCGTIGDTATSGLFVGSWNAYLKVPTLQPGASCVLSFWVKSYLDGTGTYTQNSDVPYATGPLQISGVPAPARSINFTGTTSVPTLAIVSPADQTHLAHPIPYIDIVVTASDADGIVAVDFYGANSGYIGTATSPQNGQYTFRWNNPPPGDQQLTVIAFDTNGAWRTLNSRLMLIESGKVHYVHPDHLGTPRHVVRASDNALIYTFDDADPFGKSVPGGWFGTNVYGYNLRFPGQYYDAETDTNYNYFRDYEPSTGRYVQSDPLGLKAGINTFAYVSSNPLLLNDPTGLADSTIQCDGKLARGDYEVVNNDTTCTRNCTKKHEESHIEDWKKRYGSDSCRNKPKGYLPEPPRLPRRPVCVSQADMACSVS